MVMSKAPAGSDAGTHVADEGRSFGRLVGEASIPRGNVTTASATLPLSRAALKNAAPGIKPAEFIRRHPYFYFPIRAGAALVVLRPLGLARRIAQVAKACCL
jgi:hypothetical protein